MADDDDDFVARPVPFPPYDLPDPHIYPATIIEQGQELLRREPSEQAQIAYLPLEILDLPRRAKGSLARCLVMERDAAASGGFRRTDRIVMVKQLRKDFLQRENCPDNVRNEISALQHYGDGQHVIEHGELNNEALEDEKHYYVIMKFYPRGSLRGFLHNEGYLNRADRRDPRPRMRQLATSLAHIHDTHELVHRDIDPQNILLEEDTRTVQVAGRPGNDGVHGLYTDFATAKKVQFLLGRPMLMTPQLPVGKLQYMAPEVAARLPQGQPLDVWSLGVCFFEMVSGMTLYEYPSRRDPSFVYFILRRGLSPDYDEQNQEFITAAWQQVDDEQQDGPRRNLFLRICQVQGMSEDLRLLLSRMMAYDPLQRPTAREVANDPWFDQPGSVEETVLRFDDFQVPPFPWDAL